MFCRILSTKYSVLIVSADHVTTDHATVRLRSMAEITESEYMRRESKTLIY